MAGEPRSGQLLEFLARLATREGDLGSAYQLKRRYAKVAAGESLREEQFDGYQVEGSYYDVYDATADAGPS